MVLSRF